MKLDDDSTSAYSKFSVVSGIGADGVDGKYLVQPASRNTAPEAYLVVDLKKGKTEALFKDIADMVPDDQSIAEFANRYGRLGKTAEVMVEVLDAAPSDRRVFLPGEPLADWIETIDEVKDAVNLWADIKSTRVDEREIDDRWKLLASIVSRHIVGHTTSVVTVDQKSRVFRLQLEPNSNYGLLWVQLLHAMVSNSSYRKCPECERWFEQRRIRKGVDQLYCTDACRLKVVRRDKANADLTMGEQRPIEDVYLSIEKGPTAITQMGTTWMPKDSAY